MFFFPICLCFLFSMVLDARRTNENKLVLIPHFVHPFCIEIKWGCFEIHRQQQQQQQQDNTSPMKLVPLFDFSAPLAIGDAHPTLFTKPLFKIDQDDTTRVVEVYCRSLKELKMLRKDKNIEFAPPSRGSSETAKRAWTMLQPRLESTHQRLNVGDIYYQLAEPTLSLQSIENDSSSSVVLIDLTTHQELHGSSPDDLMVQLATLYDFLINHRSAPMMVYDFDKREPSFARIATNSQTHNQHP